MKIAELYVVIFYRILSSIPPKILYKLSDWLAFIAYRIRIFPFQTITRNNLQKAFPHYSLSEIYQIEREYYKRACDFAAESIMFYSSKGPNLTVDFKNIELLERLQKKHPFIICYSGHFLNYEILTLFPREMKNINLYCYYQPSGFTNIDNLTIKFRSRHGAKLIPTTYPLKSISSTTNNTCNNISILGSLADIMPQTKHTHITHLFGQKIRAYYGTEKIGRKLNATFVYTRMKRIERGHYQVNFIPINSNNKKYMKSPYTTTDDFFDCLEENIRKQPDLWMLWGTSRFKQ